MGEKERYWSGKKGNMTKCISNIGSNSVEYECKTNRNRLAMPACGKERKSAMDVMGI